MGESKNIFQKILERSKKEIKSLDQYSKNVTFAFNGKDSFTTLLGGTTTILIKIGVLIVSILLTISIFQKDNSSRSVNKIIKDVTNDKMKHYFAK